MDEREDTGRVVRLEQAVNRLQQWRAEAAVRIGALEESRDALAESLDALRAQQGAGFDAMRGQREADRRELKGDLGLIYQAINDTRAALERLHGGRRMLAWGVGMVLSAASVLIAAIGLVWAVLG